MNKPEAFKKELSELLNKYNYTIEVDLAYRNYQPFLEVEVWDENGKIDNLNPHEENSLTLSE